MATILRHSNSMHPYIHCFTLHRSCSNPCLNSYQSSLAQKLEVNPDTPSASSRRTKIMKHVGIALSLLLLINGANAQLLAAAEQAPTNAKSTPSTTTEAEQLKERRARARSLLISLSTDARSFRDQTLRARSLARIADALWLVDPEQARMLFRKAWEAAEL